ncbi:MAG: hypothetical protein GW949_03485 [Spirochaetales bacterium]|nr:hypothetical protein [Spirochaetales bacterium]
MDIYAYSPLGYEGALVKIEVEIRRGIPGIDLVGLPDSAVKESRERIRAAMRNAGFSVPKARVLFNLSPAGLRKAGAGFDLALAVALLSATDQLPWNFSEPLLVSGELALSGGVYPVPGVLGALELAAEKGIERCILAQNEMPKHGPRVGMQVLGLEFLGQLANRILHFRTLGPGASSSELSEISESPTPTDLSWMPETQRLALGVTAAGGHHTLLLGPPGTGKSSFLLALGMLKIPMLHRHRRELDRIMSVYEGTDGGVGRSSDWDAPVLYPGPASSYEGILGGGRAVMPGQVSLAHGGFLAIDEALELGGKTLGGLRLPMEESVIRVIRANTVSYYPCEFTLVGATNLCPCGARGKVDEICQCDPKAVHRYWSRMGSALLDRFDVRMVLPQVTDDWPELPKWTGSGDEVEKAIRVSRRIMAEGLWSKNEAKLNGRLEGIRLNRKGASLPGMGPHQSFRSFAAVERLALTLAMMDNRKESEPQDIALATYLRNPPGIERWLGDFVGWGNSKVQV